VSYLIDPERNEIRLLRAVTSWKGKHVLEIGSGDGRLARRIASLGARVEGIDPDNSLVRAARRATPPRFATRLRFHVARAERLRYAAETFYIAIFGWSF
jgi:ubiquinone/menaquinone biosynthesis C-methylase UbiE